MESAHIMYMWISIVAIICICIVWCNIINAKRDENKNHTEENTYNTYDPDAMP